MTPTQVTRAGEGESRMYPLAQGTVVGPLEPEVDYLSVEAVSWFINRDSSWFNDWSASGAISIKMDDANRYQVALGAFELDGGARTAPVFDKAVLPQRAFRGGNIEIEVSLTGFKKATALLKMLKSASNASLGIVAGMVQTAGGTGPLQVLTAAGSDLISGVQSVLSESGPDRQPFFPAGAFSFTLSPDDLATEEQFVLLHRGGKLSRASLRIEDRGSGKSVFSGGLALEDGVWLLLKFTKSQRYGGFRPWQDKQRQFTSHLGNLREDVRQGVVSPTQALAALKRGTEKTPTLYDEYLTLRAQIQSDMTITERDATLRSTALSELIFALRAEINSGQVSSGHLSTLGLPVTGQSEAKQRLVLEKQAALVASARSSWESLADAGAASPKWLQGLDAPSAMAYEAKVFLS